MRPGEPSNPLPQQHKFSWPHPPMLRPDDASNPRGEALSRLHRGQTAPAVLVYAKKAAVPDAIPALALPLLFRAFSNPRMILKRVWVGKSAGVGSDLLSRGQGRGGCEGAGGRSSGACSRSAATFLSMGLRSPRAAVSLRAQPGRREPGGRAKVPAARRPPTTASGSRPAVLSCAAASAAHIRCRSSGLLAAPEKQP